MSDLVERLRSEFLPAILHGDAEHRAWLTAAVEAFIAGEPVPTPIGSGTKEARIEALEATNAEMAEALRDFLVESDRSVRPSFALQQRVRAILAKLETEKPRNL